MDANEHLEMTKEALVAAIKHLLDAQKLFKETETTEEKDETDEEIKSLLGGD